MPSRRVPHDFEPNAWSVALAEHRARGGASIDLIESNPTRLGLVASDGGAPGARVDPASITHAPDARGDRAAREAIARYYAERGAVVLPDGVVLTASTSEAYAHLFRLLADAGDEVVFPRPSYPLFEPLAALESVVPAHYRLGYDGEWHLDLDSLTGALRPRTRAVCLVQPNHPTGSCLSASELEAVESLCERHHLTLVSDEVFGDFPWAPSAPLPTLAGRTRVPTFVLSGLSKVAGLPHMKLSWIVLSGPAAERDQWLEGLEWIADLFLSVGAPVQSALPGLLESRHGFQERVARRLALNLGQLDASVKRCPEMSRLNASGGWHAVLRLPARRTSEEWAIELLRRDVRIHPGSFYDLEAEAHLVASLIVTPAAFAAGLDQIEALVRED